ncbi:MAG: hypothetical protein COA79_23030 [Planctomycetota bacterium]|nr:MAG: hypothetical protein COA79_23030 [Planctomycetota bacterium]
MILASVHAQDFSIKQVAIGTFENNKKTLIYTKGFEKNDDLEDLEDDYMDDLEKKSVLIFFMMKVNNKEEIDIKDGSYNFTLKSIKIDGNAVTIPVSDVCQKTSFNYDSFDKFIIFPLTFDKATYLGEKYEIEGSFNFKYSTNLAVIKSNKISLGKTKSFKIGKVEYPILFMSFEKRSLNSLSVNCITLKFNWTDCDSYEDLSLFDHKLNKLNNRSGMTEGDTCEYGFDYPHGKDELKELYVGFTKWADHKEIKVPFSLSSK